VEHRGDAVQVAIELLGETTLTVGSLGTRRGGL
jgi:hypothetical protein